jgi:hypothetical protein
MNNSNLLARDRLITVFLVRVFVREHRLKSPKVNGFIFSCQCLHTLAQGRAATPTLAFAAFSFFKELKCVLKDKSNWLSHGSRRPKAMQSNKNHAVYSGFFSWRPKCKPEGYHAVCVQHVALSCCLSAKQMATSTPMTNNFWNRWIYC